MAAAAVTMSGGKEADGFSVRIDAMGAKDWEPAPMESGGVVRIAHMGRYRYWFTQKAHPKYDTHVVITNDGETQGNYIIPKENTTDHLDERTDRGTSFIFVDASKHAAKADDLSTDYNPSPGKITIDYALCTTEWKEKKAASAAAAASPPKPAVKPIAPAAPAAAPLAILHHLPPQPIIMQQFQQPMQPMQQQQPVYQQPMQQQPPVHQQQQTNQQANNAAAAEQVNPVADEGFTIDGPPTNRPMREGFTTRVGPARFLRFQLKARK